MFNYKKIASVLASAVMLSSTIGFAAALSYPQPFVTSGTADAAVVWGANAAISDLSAAIDIGQSLNTLSTKGSGSNSGSGSSVTGGDSVLLAKPSDNLNLGNTWGVFTGTIDEDDLKTLLVDGTYRADDNDEFNFEQKINIGSPTMTHFRDSSYEQLIGASTRTPVIGFKISSNTYIMNYTLDFTQDAESTVTSGDLDDIEGSDLMILGKNYYVSDFKNSTLKMTLLDSAVVSTVGEGSSTTVNVKDKSYAVSITYIDNDEVVFDVNGERAPSTGKLNKGDSYKLNDGSYIGVRDISKLEIAGESGTSSFSIGSGKLELTNNADIKLNDKTISRMKSYITRGTYSDPDEKIDKIVIEWKTDEEVFLTSDQDLIMPGFGAVKFTMAELQRNSEEKITIDSDGDDSIQLTAPLKDGEVSLNLLYASSGTFTGIGRTSEERLATTGGSELLFYEQNGGSDYDEYFVASYNTTSEAESYLLRAKVNQDISAGRNETDIEKNVDGSWVVVCKEKAAGDTCDIGDVSLTINTVQYTSGGNEVVNLTAGTGVTFNNLYTAGGLRIRLPYAATNSSSSEGAINFSTAGNSDNLGHNASSFYVFMHPENKDDDLGLGTHFSFTLDDNSDDNLHVPSVNATGGGAGSGSGDGGLEKGTSTNVYERYVVDDVATRILHYTNPDEDYVEIYYPSANSETYAEVYLTEAGASIVPGSTGTTVGKGGQVLVVKDSEMSSVSGKNLVVVGGSCINTAAAKILNSDSPLCTSAFTAATGVGPGQYIIKTVKSPWANDKVAMLVAGYGAADTTNAVKKAMEGSKSDVGTEQVYPITSA